MDIQDAHDFKIKDSQFLDVHGDQTIHHHVRSVEVDGQNNSAIFHEDHRSTLDNRIINENCSNMVIYAQGQNCQVTLDAIDLPFLRNRNRNRERTSQNLSSPLKNGSPFDTLRGEGQNNARQTVTSNATYHQNYNNNNTGQMSVIELGNDDQTHSSGMGSVTPTQPLLTSQISGAQPSRQEIPVRASPGPEDKPTLTYDTMTLSDPSGIMTSSGRAAERSHTVNGATARSPTSSEASISVTSPTETTLEQRPPISSSPSGSEEPQRDTRVQRESYVSGIPAEKPVSQNQITLMHRMLQKSTARSGAGIPTPATEQSLMTEMLNEDQGTNSSDTGRANTRKKNILWFLQRGFHRMFIGWKNVREKMSRV